MSVPSEVLSIQQLQTSDLDRLIDPQWIASGKAELARTANAIPLRFDPNNYSIFYLAIGRGGDLSSQDNFKASLQTNLSELMGMQVTIKYIEREPREVLAQVEKHYPAGRPDRFDDARLPKIPAAEGKKGKGDATTEVKVADRGYGEEWIWEIPVLRELEAQIASGEVSPGKKNVYMNTTGALLAGATDIHIKANAQGYAVYYRVDGDMIYQDQIAFREATNVNGFLKSNTSIGHNNKLNHESGRAKVIKAEDGGTSKEYDLRIQKSVVGKGLGEEYVIRILDKSKKWSIEKLQLAPWIRERLEELVAEPYGMVIFTGPTGSGKSTSQYACLQHIADRFSNSKNILTVEDPIEYDLEGVSQTQVNLKAGVTFASTLRSFLRQDPDVIMVGEMRDLEVTDVALQAAETGHLVLSTIHANEAAGAFTRLKNMKAPKDVTSSAVVGVIAQRLVKTINPNAMDLWDFQEGSSVELLGKHGYVGEDFPVKIPVLKPNLSIADQRRAYKGRVAIMEILRVTPEIIDMILAEQPAQIIREKAVEQGMRTMLHDGLYKVAQGKTSVAEVMDKLRRT